MIRNCNKYLIISVYKLHKPVLLVVLKTTMMTSHCNAVSLLVLLLEPFKYLGTTLKNQNSIYEEIKSRLNSENACYHLVQILLSTSLPSKNVKIEIYRTIILPVILYGCGTWSLVLREECRPRVFENKVLRRILGPKRDEATGEWGRLRNKELHALYSSPHIFWLIKPRLRWAGHVACME